jgi:ABC-type multidrug transport system ATPase subunit
MNEIVREKIAAYVSQSDLHSEEMTVRETLAFSAKCQGAGDGYGNNMVHNIYILNIIFSNRRRIWCMSK